MKIVKIMFRKNYTKWKPLGTMDFQGKEYVTMIRKNKKNGMLQFKTIRINGFFLVLWSVFTAFFHEL